MNPTIHDRLAAQGLSHGTDPSCAPGFRMIRQADGTSIGCFDAKGAVELLAKLDPGKPCPDCTEGWTEHCPAKVCGTCKGTGRAA